MALQLIAVRDNNYVNYINITVVTHIMSVHRYQYNPSKFYLHFCHYCALFISWPSCSRGDSVHDSVSSVLTGLD